MLTTQREIYTLPDTSKVFRVKVVTTLLRAGIANRPLTGIAGGKELLPKQQY